MCGCMYVHVRACVLACVCAPLAYCAIVQADAHMLAQEHTLHPHGACFLKLSKRIRRWVCAPQLKPMHHKLGVKPKAARTPRAPPAALAVADPMHHRHTQPQAACAAHTAGACTCETARTLYPSTLHMRVLY